jgi:hypothetical protein
LILADDTEAELIELATGQLMQWIDHMVVSALEVFVDTGRVRNRQIKRPTVRRANKCS